MPKLTTEEARELARARWEKHAAAIRAEAASAAGEAPVAPLAPLAHLAAPDLDSARAKAGKVIARAAAWVRALLEPSTDTNVSAS